MALTKIQPSDYILIVDRIREGLCVPFLGAGVNVSSGTYKGLPLANDVAISLVRKLGNLPAKKLRELTSIADEDIRRRLVQAVAEPPLTDEEMNQLTQAELQQRLAEAEPLPSLLRVGLPDLARVALHVEVQFDFKYLLGQIYNVIKDAECEPSPLLKTLASLPFKLLVTTNYDRLLERAFGDRPYELVVQPVNGFEEKDHNRLQERLADPGGPILYKIHGSFYDTANGHDENNRLILTEEDYIQFLSVVGREDRGVPTLITEKLINGTILFLGYSLQDWDFRTIYKTLIEPLPEKLRPTSIAIQKNPPDFWVRYWADKKVKILDVDLYEFAAQLERYWNKKDEDD